MIHDWKPQSSSVVCRQLGCGSAVSTEREDHATSRPLWEIGNCVGSESLLRECGAIQSDTSYSSLEQICSGKKMTSTMILIYTVCLSVCIFKYVT